MLRWFLLFTLFSRVLFLPTIITYYDSFFVYLHVILSKNSEI